MCTITVLGGRARSVAIAVVATALAVSVALARPTPREVVQGHRQHGPLPSGVDVKTPAQVFELQPLSPDRAAALGTASAHAPAPQDDTNPATGTGPAPPRIRLEEPLFDDGPGGSMIAVGDNYKARFTSEGFSYIPRLDRSAPGNFPIHFAVESVCADGAPLMFGGATPQRSGANVVRFERGLFTEAYDVGLRAVEQTFTFHHRPATLSGDIIIRLALDTQFAAEDAGDCLLFSNMYGSVSYSKAVLVDAQRNRSGLSTALVGERHIDITIPQALLASAVWPITIDPVIQNNVVDGGTSSRLPDAAYDVTSNTYLVVWEVNVSASDGDVFARRTDALGAAIGSVITIDSSTENWRNPRVANNDLNNNHLVVAERGAAGSREIVGRVVSAANGATGAAFVISDAAVTGEKINPDVGGDSFAVAPVHWLVVWQRVVGAADHDIHARLVTPSGATTAAPDGNTIFIDNSSATLDINPSVSASNRGFAWPVAWQRDLANDDIMGARVFFDGSILHATFAIDNTAADTQHPSVATPFPTSRYVVAYEDGPGVLGHIRARAFDDITLLDDDDLTMIENVALTQRRRLPRIDASATQVVVTCEQEATVAIAGVTAPVDAITSTYCWSGQALSLAEPHRIVANTSDDDATPVVAGASGSNGPAQQFLIAWNRRSLATGFGSVNAASYNSGTCCPSDVNDSGATDVDDLVGVILAWGACVTCPADINGDGLVNVDDLVAVILGWGACS